MNPQPITFPTDAQAEADIRHALAEITSAQADCPTPTEIQLAVDKLTDCERGRDVARAFRRLLLVGGIGLDVANWSALIVLCRACRGGALSATLDRLPITRNFPDHANRQA